MQAEKSEESKKHKYTADGFEKAWDDYKPEHPSPIGIGSVYALANQLNIISCGPIVWKEHTDSSIEHTLGPLSVLKSFSATGMSQILKENMLADVFVMKDIAILGQWTTLYAAPSTGKTLLTLWMLKEQIDAGVLDASKVFYVNVDDNYRGAVEKIEIAEKFGMQMLAPNINRFNQRDLLSMIRNFAATDESRDVVIVLDTLKKFTDLMDKTASSAFGDVAREFVLAGGTLICLAHPNKHKDAEGKSIAGGTSDITDDSDCVFIIDKVSISKEFMAETHTVEFTNKKARGDVASTASFSYEKTVGLPYSTLLDSVKSLNLNDLDEIKNKAASDKQFEEDKEVIESVIVTIKSGITAKNQIIKDVVAATSAGHKETGRVLERWTGNDYDKNHRWSFTVGAHNKADYSLLPKLPLTLKTN
jgi:archaellum biogenesis ATPase FlaH